MPSAVSGRQWPAESPAKKTPSSVGRAQLVGDPVALVAHGVRAQVLGQLHGVVLHVEARVEGAHADAQLVVARGSSSRSRRARTRGRSRSPGRRRAPCGCTSRPRDSGASGGWKPSSAPASAASPGRPRSAARSGRRGRCGPCRRCGRPPWRSRTRSRPARTAARTARGSRRSRRSRAAASARSPYGVWTTSSGKVWRWEPIRPSASSHAGGDAAGGGLALADLVAVDHQHAGRRASPASSRATARPAKLAPQMSTS